jgi:hypothetical protein
MPVAMGDSQKIGDAQYSIERNTLWQFNIAIENDHL